MPVYLLSNSLAGVVQYVVTLVLKVILPSLLQKQMENRRIIHSVVTKSLRVYHPGLYLTVAFVTEIVLLDNPSGKVFDVETNVAKFLQSLLSLCRPGTAFTAPVLEILKKILFQVLVILP